MVDRSTPFFEPEITRTRRAKRCQNDDWRPCHTVERESGFGDAHKRWRSSASCIIAPRRVVNALFKVGKNGQLGRPAGDRAQIFQDLLILQCEAEKHGIEMTVDDEFGRLSEEDRDRDVVDINALRIRRLTRSSGVFRLLPNGQCSMGVELLEEVAPDTPR